MGGRVLGFLVALGLLLARPVLAEPRSAVEWQEMLTKDLAFAKSFLAENHPASQPGVGDKAFRDWLEAGAAEAQARAAQVTDAAGYRAVLAAYAVGFGDGHIRFRFKQGAQAVRWPGFTVGLRGGRWTVVSVADGEPGLPPVGAELLSCDGTPVDSLAKTRLGVFRGDWSIPAQRARGAPYLLVDLGVPFLPPLATCTLAVDGKQQALPLAWREVPAAEIAPKLRAAVQVGAAGFGIRKVGQGYWVALQSLGSDAEAVIEAARDEAKTLRAAPFVVVDLRGNGGGNSRWGQELAEALVGKELARANLPEVTGNCSPRWRVTPGNADTADRYVAEFGDKFGFMARRSLKAQAEDMREALATGQPFVPALNTACTIGSPPRAKPPSLMKGRIILLTDIACFSSCLIVTQSFRALGALHVGEGTDAGTWYTEVREQELPSGLGTISTMQAFAPSLPRRLGPFEPEMPYPGDISDTGALERWVLGLVAP